MAVAWDKAAVNSPAFMRTSPSPSPAVLGCSSRFTFSWKDCALAAVAAGETGAATGAGFRKTSTNVNTEIPSVAKLTIRCHFKGHPRWSYGIRREGSI